MINSFTEFLDEQCSLGVSSYLPESQQKKREVYLIRAANMTMRFVIYPQKIQIKFRDKFRFDGPFSHPREVDMCSLDKDSNFHVSEKPLEPYYATDVSSLNFFKPFRSLEEFTIEKISELFDGISKLDPETRKALEERKKKLLSEPIFRGWWDSRRVSNLKKSKRIGI